MFLSTQVISDMHLVLSILGEFPWQPARFNSILPSAKVSNLVRLTSNQHLVPGVMLEIAFPCFWSKAGSFRIGYEYMSTGPKLIKDGSIRYARNLKNVVIW